MHARLIFCLMAMLSFPAQSKAQAQDQTAAEASAERGKKLFLQQCHLCHQANGQGTRGVFPPLAKSDFLLADKVRSIRILCEGISQLITVNGVQYNGSMAPVALNDQEAADVLTYIRTAWGNTGDAVTAEEVRVTRTKTRFKTYEDLVRASSYAPLPAVPEGCTLREVIRMPEHPVKLAGDRTGKVLYSLNPNGNIWRIDTKSGSFRLLLRGERYVDKALGNVQALGLVLDSQRRLYIAVNQRNETVTPVRDEVTIFRTARELDGDPFDPQPWLRTSYPWGVGPFNHCVNHMAFGPDGFLYVNSGSRTDGNETGTDPKYSREGETPLTSCMWRLDPKSEKPELEIFARGLRNSFGFTWGVDGKMVASENGPDADAPEELNVIEKGNHYGFPFQFSDWDKKPYPYTPDAPAGVTFTRPVANLGPDGGFAGSPLYTFDPHSSPAGIAALDDGFPKAWQGTFLITRFGNLLKKPKDVGFDILQARITHRKGGGYEASMKTVIAPLARPIDLFVADGGRVFIAEYTRPLDFKSGLPQMPGRILELTVGAAK